MSLQTQSQAPDGRVHDARNAHHRTVCAMEKVILALRKLGHADAAVMVHQALEKSLAKPADDKRGAQCG